MKLIRMQLDLQHKTQPIFKHKIKFDIIDIFNLINNVKRITELKKKI